MRSNVGEWRMNRWELVRCRRQTNTQCEHAVVRSQRATINAVSSTQLIMSAAEASVQPQSVAVSRNGPDGNATAMCQELPLKLKSTLSLNPVIGAADRSARVTLTAPDWLSADEQNRPPRSRPPGKANGSSARCLLVTPQRPEQQSIRSPLVMGAASEGQRRG